MSHAPWGDVTFSEHGQWWHLLWAAIYSAYGRTPYFEFYQDDFEPIFKTHPLSLQAFNSLIDRTVRNILGIPSPATSVEGLAQECSIDLRSRPIPPIPVVEYYQVWSAKYGFTPGLSILDLIFNMGPEAPLILRQMASGINLNDF